MNRYAIYCTPEQTKKALALGAPIEKIRISQRDTSRPVYFTDAPLENWECDAYYRPTAEQMVGWLEEQHPIDHIDVYKQITTWRYCMYTSTLNRKFGKGNTRPEATLAAIDAALEYLTNHKQ